MGGGDRGSEIGEDEVSGGWGEEDAVGERWPGAVVVVRGGER